MDCCMKCKKDILQDSVAQRCNMEPITQMRLPPSLVLLPPSVEGVCAITSARSAIYLVFYPGIGSSYA
jgi:hypothetical protein